MKEINSYTFKSNYKNRKDAIFLGYYEGYEFINKQIKSIFKQT